MIKRVLVLVFACLSLSSPAIADCNTPSGYTRQGSSSWLYSEAISGSPGFERLPRNVAGLSSDIQAAGMHSTGRTLRFNSNSDTLHVCWEMGTLDPDHLDVWSPTGKSGVDLYTRPAGSDDWVWVSSGIPKSTNMGEAYFQLGTSEAREFMLYLPLGRRTTLMRIETKTGSTFGIASQPVEAPYVILGSSITWGASSSRAGSAYPSILARHRDVDLVNMGFAGACQMLPSLATLIASVEASAYILDCFPNMTPEQITDQMPGFVSALATQRPNTPIYILQDRRYQNQFDPVLAQRNADKLAAIMTVLPGLQLAHSNLIWVPSDDLLGDDFEGTVDGSHPSDLGHYRYANALIEAMTP